MNYLLAYLEPKGHGPVIYQTDLHIGAKFSTAHTREDAADHAHKFLVQALTFGRAGSRCKTCPVAPAGVGSKSELRNQQHLSACLLHIQVHHVVFIRENAVIDQPRGKAVYLRFGIIFFDRDKDQQAGADRSDRLAINFHGSFRYSLQQCDHGLTGMIAKLDHSTGLPSQESPPVKLKILLLFTRALALLPFSWLMALATPLGALLASGGRRRQITLRNLSACFPEKNEAELLALTRAHCREFVKLGLESPVLWHWPVEQVLSLVHEVRGQHILDAALAQGNGLVISLPHIGSWEMVSLYMSQHTDFAAIYKPSENEDVDRLIALKRERFGSKMFAADASGLRQAFKHLKAGGVLCILPDQQPKEGEGQFAPFFGLQTLTMTLLSKMVQRSECEIINLTCERLADNSGYRMHFMPADPDIRSIDMDVSLAAVNRGVETCISIAPEQYLWSYKRFSIRPEGEEKFY